MAINAVPLENDPNRFWKAQQLPDILPNPSNTSQVQDTRPDGAWSNLD